MTQRTIPHRLNRLLLGDRVPVHADTSDRMRALAVGWLSLVTITVQLPFIGINLLRDPTGIISAGNVVVVVAVCLNLWFFRRTGRVRATSVTGLCLIAAWIIWAALRSQTSLLVWAMVLPVPAFLLLGVNQGLKWSIFFGFAFGLTALLHQDPNGPGLWRLDLPLTYFSVMFLALIGEYVREQYANRLRELSLIDALTGALNRRAFEERAHAEIERSRRYAHPLAILLIDADHFKSVNDRYGHAEGDAVLCELTGLTRGSLRSMDCLARWGGEEFAALLPETDGERAHEAAERIRHTIELAPALRDRGVTVSIGVAGFSASDSLESALARADAALYRAKSDGRNCCRSP